MDRDKRKEKNIFFKKKKPRTALVLHCQKFFFFSNSWIGDIGAEGKAQSQKAKAADR